jgi:ferredoxin
MRMVVEGDRRLVGAGGESVAYAAAHMNDSLEMLACRRCGALFFVCSTDYRGQTYCGSICRAAARVVSARAARMRHERSTEGRLDHRDRQRAYRMRLRARVTDHASPAVTLPSKMSPPRSEPTPRAPVRADLATCARCGCASAWVRWVPFPGARICARRWARKGRTATVRRQPRQSLLSSARGRGGGVVAGSA